MDLPAGRRIKRTKATQITKGSTNKRKKITVDHYVDRNSASSSSSPMWGVGVLPITAYNGEAPRERGTFFNLQVYERVEIYRAEVYERVGKSVV